MFKTRVEYECDTSNERSDVAFKQYRKYCMQVDNKTLQIPQISMF